jgi:hypothetical protein
MTPQAGSRNAPVTLRLTPGVFRPYSPVGSDHPVEVTR